MTSYLASPEIFTESILQQRTGNRQEAGGRRQEAGGRRQEAGGVIKICLTNHQSPKATVNCQLISRLRSDYRFIINDCEFFQKTEK